MEQHDKTSNVSGSRESVHGETRRTGVNRLPALSTSELSIGEYFLVWRRRIGLNQKQAGKLIGMSRHQYCAWEASNAETRPSFFPTLGDELFSHEKCFIFRRRAGWTIPACADQAGVSRYWFNLMELGKVSPDRLIQYWIENEG